MKKDAKIFVAGANGLVGSAIVRCLQKNGYTNLLTPGFDKLDLRSQNAVQQYFKLMRPQYVFLAAAKVGGIGWNAAAPGEFMYDNLMIQTNVIDSAMLYNTHKLCFLGSACIYPKHASVPIKEEHLLTGPLEETNISYALAKIAGYMMCKQYSKQYGLNCVSVMPNNIYGVRDNFKPDQCHVIPSFINRFIAAKEKNEPFVTCFGDGTPTREFLFADDVADACLYLMLNHDDPEIINIGPNHEISIKELAEMVANKVGYQGQILWDTTRPNGTPRRALDTSKMDALGWKAKTSLDEGLDITIRWFLANRNHYERV